MAADPSVESFASTHIVILVADLAGYHRAFGTHSDSALARFLDRFYRLAEHVIANADGEIVKFMGDAILAVFPPDRAGAAVESMISLEVRASQLAAEHGLELALGANIHLGSAVRAELGAEASCRKDVIGQAVNHAFMLGRGVGIRITEPVYRQLPSGQRGPWERRGPPTVYVLGGPAEPYATPRKTAAQNAVRPAPRAVVSSVEVEYHRYKVLAEDAMVQVTAEEMCTLHGGSGNSIATVVWHLSGNFRSRFTDFLSSDGEKPWRERDSEFQSRQVSRAGLTEKWDEGWRVLLATLASLSDADLERIITIRSVPLTVLQALHRSLAHAAYHVGQIVYLARSMRGPDWRYLSIPPGKSEAYRADPNLERQINHPRPEDITNEGRE